MKELCMIDCLPHSPRALPPHSYLAAYAGAPLALPSPPARLCCSAFILLALLRLCHRGAASSAAVYKDMPTEGCTPSPLTFKVLTHGMCMAQQWDHLRLIFRGARLGGGAVAFCLAVC